MRKLWVIATGLFMLFFYYLKGNEGVEQNLQNFRFMVECVVIFLALSYAVLGSVKIILMLCFKKNINVIRPLNILFSSFLLSAVLFGLHNVGLSLYALFSFGLFAHYLLGNEKKKKPN